MADSKLHDLWTMNRDNMLQTNSNAANMANWSENLQNRSSEVHAIIHKQSIEHLENIIKNGWDANEELLITECEHQRKDTGGYAIVTSSVHRCSALQEAVRHTWVDGVRTLINAGAKVNLCPGVLDPLTIALCCTRTKEQLNIVKLLLENGGDPNGKTDSEEDAPLIYAIRECTQKGSDSKIVEILLESGADPNLAKRGYLPVGYPFRYPLPLTVEYLVRSLRDLNTQTPIDRVGQLLIENQRKDLKKTNTAIFECLLIFGVDVNSNVGLDGPLLHRMVGRFGDFSGGFYELLPVHLELMYQYGCDVDLRDKYLGSALECTMRECGMTHNVRWLLRHGADATGLPFNILKNQYIPECSRPKRMSPYIPRVLLSHTPLVLFEAGMIVPQTLSCHLLKMQQIIQSFLRKADNIDEEQLFIEVESQWSRITQGKEQHKSGAKKSYISPECRMCQMTDLEEFSDESLYIYPEDEYNPKPTDQWLYCLDIVGKTLDYMTQPRTLQWWCRCCIRESLVSLHPSVVKTLPGPAGLKRFVLCHDV